MQLIERPETFLMDFFSGTIPRRKETSSDETRCVLSDDVGVRSYIDTHYSFTVSLQSTDRW